MPVLTFNDAKAASDVTGATLDLYNSTTVSVYALDPAHETEFIDYYQTTALGWLKARGMTEGKGWIVNHQLIYTALPVCPPWDGMPGLEKYLSKNHPPLPQELPYDDGSGATQAQSVPQAS